MIDSDSSDKTFRQISETIQAHLEARDWQDNPPRGLAISIALEANELLEHYQWGDKPVGKRQDLAEELADIFIYAFQFAHSNDIDIPTAILEKLDKAAKKYPADQFKGKTDDEKNEAWINNKLRHKKQLYSNHLPKSRVASITYIYHESHPFIFT